MIKLHHFLLLLAVAISLSACSHIEATAYDELRFLPFAKLIKNRAVLAHGIAFDSARSIGINPFTGKNVDPCASGKDLFIPRRFVRAAGRALKTALTGDKPANQACSPSQIVDASPEIMKAINSSAAPIEGFVKDHGVIKKARFVITVTALHEDSYCTTTFSEGQQLTNCVDKEEKCEVLELLGLAC